MLTIKKCDNQKDYFNAMFIRSRVFVIEQNVSVDIEIDELDSTALHFIVYDNDNPIATCRILPSTNNKVILGRLAVLKEYRHQKVATKLLEYVENYLKNNNIQKIELHSQLHALPFYTTLGYTEFGDIFVEAGIKHIKMEKSL